MIAKHTIAIVQNSDINNDINVVVVRDNLIFTCREKAMAAQAKLNKALCKRYGNSRHTIPDHLFYSSVSFHDNFLISKEILLGNGDGRIQIISSKDDQLMWESQS